MFFHPSSTTFPFPTNGNHLLCFSPIDLIYLIYWLKWLSFVFISNKQSAVHFGWKSCKSIIQKHKYHLMSIITKRFADEMSRSFWVSIGSYFEYLHFTLQDLCIQSAVSTCESQFICGSNSTDTLCQTNCAEALFINAALDTQCRELKKKIHTQKQPQF